MIDFEYLSKGLNALARAHLMGPMAGHLGAAVVAGYFVGEQRPDLDPRVVAGIENDLERVMRGESVFGKKMAKKATKTDPELFLPFPKQKPDESLVDGIAESLEKNIGKPRASGHNVIFASLAVRALKEHPEFATPSIVDGIRKLISLFNNIHPGSGNYGKDRGRISGNKITLPEKSDIPQYEELQGMAIAVLDQVIGQDPGIHRQGYGGLVHVINHAAAITDLAQYGYPELVRPAVASHRLHFRLWHNLPDLSEELGPVKVSPHTPHESAYWTEGKIPYDRALLTHRVKTMFGFDELGEATDDKVKLRKAYDKLRFMM